MLKWRNVVCWLVLVIFPTSLLADDTGAAILRSNGIVLLNRNPALPASALFPDDLIETQDKAVARIEAFGSAVDLNPGTVVQFEGNELFLDHGSLSVNTSRGMKVRVGCVTVVPVNAEWTHFEVSDVDGKVTVSAVKNDVDIDARSTRTRQAKEPGSVERVTVREGEQKSRDEKCGAAPVRSASVSGIGAMLNSPWARGAGIAAVTVLTCWSLCRSGPPMSPSDP